MPSFSLDEIKAIAAEVGLDAGAVERAARQLPVDRHPSWVERALGGPVKHRRDAFFPAVLTREDAERVLVAVREAAEQHGQGDASSAGMSWRSVGEPSQMYATVRREGEGTRVRVTVDRGGGLLLTGFLSTIGGIIAASIVGAVLDPASAVVGTALVGGGLAAGLTVGRALWAATTRSVRHRLDRIMDAVGSSMDEAERTPHTKSS